MEFKSLQPPTLYLAGAFLSLSIFSLYWVAQNWMRYSRCDPSTGVISNIILQIEGVRDVFTVPQKHYKSSTSLTFRDMPALSHLFPPEDSQCIRMSSGLILLNRTQCWLEQVQKRYRTFLKIQFAAFTYLLLCFVSSLF